MKAFFQAVIISTASLLLVSCANQSPSQIVSSIPIKDEIMGLKLGEKSSERDIKGKITKATDKSFVTYEEKQGSGRGIRAMATGFDFNFGGHSWSYADFNLNEESLLCAISFIHSYENVERAKEQYEELVETLSQKYGRYNRNDESSVYWTDGTTSVGTRFEESSAINGNDRSFCYLYYVDNTLIEQVKDDATDDL